jgi:hypothetical protein
MRILLWLIPLEAFDPRARPFTWDLRSYYDDIGCEIHPIRASDERRTTGLGSNTFAENIDILQSDFKCPDADTPNQMAHGVHTTVFRTCTPELQNLLTLLLRIVLRQLSECQIWPLWLVYLWVILCRLRL